MEILPNIFSEETSDPPFGHVGERKLNQLMHPHGGFEGNAQTLRILTELIYERPGSTQGIAPTRALLDGVMKYKALHRECLHTDSSGALHYPEHHFIYDQQAHWREVIFDRSTLPPELTTPAALNAFKSIECQVMDWADDTAYSLNDIVDGIHARYINVGSLTEWAAGQTLDRAQGALLDKLCQVIREDRYESYFGARIGRFVHGCSLRKRTGFLSAQTNRHAFDLHIDPAVKAESKLYKRIALDLIFRSPQLQQIEFKGGHILEKLFRALSQHCANTDGSGLRILPAPVQALLEQETCSTGRHRRLCDFTAGLTDSLAVRTHKRLYDPDFGSIAEML